MDRGTGRRPVREHLPRRPPPAAHEQHPHFIPCLAAAAAQGRGAPSLRRLCFGPLRRRDAGPAAGLRRHAPPRARRRVRAGRLRGAAGPQAVLRHRPVHGHGTGHAQRLRTGSGHGHSPSTSPPSPSPTPFPYHIVHGNGTMPMSLHGLDAHYNQWVGDVIKGGKMPYEDGCLRVPEGPGLGVELDHDLLDELTVGRKRSRTCTPATSRRSGRTISTGWAGARTGWGGCGRRGAPLG